MAPQRWSKSAEVVCDLLEKKLTKLVAAEWTNFTPPCPAYYFLIKLLRLTKDTHFWQRCFFSAAAVGNIFTHSFLNQLAKVRKLTLFQASEAADVLNQHRDLCWWYQETAGGCCQSDHRSSSVNTFRCLRSTHIIYQA